MPSHLRISRSAAEPPIYRLRISTTSRSWSVMRQRQNWTAAIWSVACAVAVMVSLAP